MLSSVFAQGILLLSKFHSHMSLWVKHTDGKLSFSESKVVFCHIGSCGTRFFCGGQWGGKMRFWGGKNPKNYKNGWFWLFFLLTGGKWGGGRASDGGGGQMPPCPLDAGTAHRISLYLPKQLQPAVIRKRTSSLVLSSIFTVWPRNL